MDKGSSADPKGNGIGTRSDFRLGEVLVQPSLRTIQGPTASATVEPRVMQVLLVLTDQIGSVVTREELLRRCWPGMIVGDDSLNRAIAELRRAARSTGNGFSVETISRVGYRIVVEPAAENDPQGPANGKTKDHSWVTRRIMIGGGVAALASLAVWSATQDEREPRVEALVEQGSSALLDFLPGRDAEAVRAFRQALALAPNDPAVLGWLSIALARVAGRSGPQKAGVAARQSEDAARRALALDPEEPNALVALATARGQATGWLEAERSYLNILDHSPDNLAALSELTALLQAVGRCRESLAFNERAIAIEPLATVHLQRKALKHWIFGQANEADRVIDAALLRRPRHPLLWNARLLIYAYTGRPQAARVLIDQAETRPAEEMAQSLEVWRVSLQALESRSADDIEAAIRANMTAATRSHGAAANAVMLLSELDALDSAFTIAEGFLLRRGPVVGPLGGGSGQQLSQDPRWRHTQWLFTPATRNFRADPRFPTFCADIGLRDYWQKRGVGPDRMN